MEIILSAVFKTCCGGSIGPDVQLFKRFKQDWSSIDCKRFCNGISNSSVAVALNKFGKDEIISFTLSQLKVHNIIFFFFFFVKPILALFDFI